MEMPLRGLVCRSWGSECASLSLEAMLKAAWQELDARLFAVESAYPTESSGMCKSPKVNPDDQRMKAYKCTR